VAAVGTALALIGAGSLPAAASASHSPIAIIQDVHDPGAPADPRQTLAQVRALGASTTRVIIPWATLAPSPGSARKPAFDASDPNAYPASGWAPYDAIVRAAAQDGLTVDFTVSGGAPRWAERGPVPAAHVTNPMWRGSRSRRPPGRSCVRWASATTALHPGRGFLAVAGREF
jgi:hypothetical protein